MPRRLAVIPARGGSKRIPNKNIREFCGQPIIAHILNAAKESGLFETIHVSTDSVTIANVVQEFGFDIDFMRIETLADDHTPLMPVLRYVVDQFSIRGEHFDQVWLLMACAPLVKKEDLIAASLVHDSEKPSMSTLAVCEYPAPIEWAFEIKEGKDVLTPVSPGMFSVRSQDLKKCYYDAGVFVIFPTALIRESIGAGSDAEFAPFVLSRDKAVDIDTESDWEYAELLFRLSKTF